MKDRFSNHARQYATFRPVYPQELYDFIYRHVPSFDLAWDAGTGNGQVARELAKKFNRVEATDISEKQIEYAVRSNNIHYSIAGETTSFKNNSFDLVTVAQAIHWFNIPVFCDEVKRVLKPNGLLAVWGYGLLRINPKADDIINDFYFNVVGPYWDKERKLIDQHYATIPFPFSEVSNPGFVMKFYWTREELFGYLCTWSSVQKYMIDNGSNPVERLMNQLDTKIDVDKMEVTFPLFLRLGSLT